MRAVHAALILLLAGAAATSMPAPADVLVLEDAETLTGKTLRITEGALVFRTTLSGQMMVPMDTVQGLTVEGNMVISMIDGRVFYGRFKSGSEGPQIVPLDGNDPQAVDLAQVQEALPIPSTPTADDREPVEGAARRLHGSVDVGIVSRTGNRDRAEAFTQIKLSKESEERAIEASLQVERDDAEYFPSLARADVEWRRERGGGAAPYAAAAVERDTDAALDARAELTLGLHRLFFEGEAHQLRGYAGLGYTYEDWDASTLEERGGAHVSGPDERIEDEIHGQLRLRYSRGVFLDGTLKEDLVLYPSLSRLGDFHARSETSLTFPVTAQLRLRLHLQLDYDNDPAFSGLDEWATAVGASVGWDF